MSKSTAVAGGPDDFWDHRGVTTWRVGWSRGTLAGEAEEPAQLNPFQPPTQIQNMSKMKFTIFSPKPPSINGSVFSPPSKWGTLITWWPSNTMSHLHPNCYGVVVATSRLVTSSCFFLSIPHTHTHTHTHSKTTQHLTFHRNQMVDVLTGIIMWLELGFVKYRLIFSKYLRLTQIKINFVSYIFI